MPRNQPKRTEFVAFGMQLQHARKAAGLSQTRLGELLTDDWKQSTVSEWEQGRTECPPAVVMEIEELLDLAPGDLTRYLGYLPESAAGRTIEWDTVTAISRDPHLTEVQRQALLATYRSYR